jgi:hypothetical protein
MFAPIPVFPGAAFTNRGLSAGGQAVLLSGTARPAVVTTLSLSAKLAFFGRTRGKMRIDGVMQSRCSIRKRRCGRFPFQIAILGSYVSWD